jgi:biotin synthase
VEDTPVSKGQKFDPLDFVRTIAVARIAMSRSMVRLSASARR